MAATKTQYTPEEIAERGTQFYDTRIRRLVEADNIDRYLAINVETGDYAVADQRYEAARAVRQRHPDAQIWFIRIGHIAAASFGGGSTREKQ
jgi:hypothetical protein